MKRIDQGKILCVKNAVGAHLLGPDYCWHREDGVGENEKERVEHSLSR